MFIYPVVNELITKEITVKFTDKSELSFEYDSKWDNFLVQELNPITLQYSKGEELNMEAALELLCRKVRGHC